ncbi:MAG: hypothetical protein Q7S01_02010 [bacterium]|nr:hypothetical protein [bacterium]
MRNTIAKSIVFGLGASLILLAVYFLALTFVSGWSFTVDQFLDFWYFVVALAIGFGIQIGLFIYLRNLVHGSSTPLTAGGGGSGKVLGVTGTTSTAAMISCCTHYLANLLPILGISGAVTFVTQYQVELFWVGLLFNLAGIAFILNSIRKVYAMQISR